MFGLSPILLNIGTVLTSLQTGAVNAFAAPPVAALTLQWHSRVKHLTDVPLLYTYGVLAISNKHFGKLSAEDHKVVRSVLESTLAKLDQDSRAENIAAFDAIQKQGLKLVTPSAAEMADWQTYAEKATRELVEEGEISAAMLQRLKDLLAEHRAAN